MAQNITRQTTPLETSPETDHLNSGYEGSPSDNFYLPPCGIEDCDIALHRLFDKDIGFTNKQFAGQTKNIQLSKPFVIFATGERFAVAKKLRPPRDKEGKLMLPAISIRRTGIEQTVDDISGRGINQHTGILTIKRRLSNEDRDYQNLINKLGLQNLQTGTVSSNRTDQGENKFDRDITDGALLTSKVNNNNIWEIITIPQPQFFTANYEVIFWTNYTQHMNYMLETLFSSYLPQGRNHKLVTDKGYWFIAFTDEQKTSSDNFEDLKDDQRMIRYTFNVKVKGYILATDSETGMVPVRRWLSSPQIVFDIVSMNGDEIQSKKNIDRIESSEENNKFALTDINEDPKEKQKPTTLDKFVVKKNFIDPVSVKKKTKYVSILQKNNVQGETIYKASNIETIEELIKTIK
jgi:hypothetical protein